jgi:hypothetical protein
VLDTPKEELSLQISMEIGTHFCHINHNIKTFLNIIFEQFEPTLHQRHIEPMIKFLYLLSHPIYEAETSLQLASQKVHQIIMDKLKTQPLEIKNALRTLGNNYSHIITNYFLKLHYWALDVIKENWASYSDYEKINYAFTFICARLPNNDWEKFFEEMLKDLNIQQISLLVTLYERINKKNYYIFDLVIKSLLDNAQKEDLKALLLKKVIDFLLITPTVSVLNKKGNPNQKIYKLLETLPNKYENLIEMNVSVTELIKMGKWLRQAGIEQDYPASILLSDWECKRLPEKNNNTDYSSLELAEFIIDALEDRNNEISNKEGLDERYKKMIRSIYNDLQAVMDNTKHSEKSFSWIIKFAKLYTKVGEFFPELRDKTYIGFLCDLV